LQIVEDADCGYGYRQAQSIWLDGHYSGHK